VVQALLAPMPGPLALFPGRSARELARPGLVGGSMVGRPAGCPVPEPSASARAWSATVTSKFGETLPDTPLLWPGFSWRAVVRESRGPPTGPCAGGQGASGFTTAPDVSPTAPAAKRRPSVRFRRRFASGVARGAGVVSRHKQRGHSQRSEGIGNDRREAADQSRGHVRGVGQFQRGLRVVESVQVLTVVEDRPKGQAKGNVKSKKLKIGQLSGDDSNSNDDAPDGEKECTKCGQRFDPSDRAATDTVCEMCTQPGPTPERKRWSN
jgi:hypothetical protein